MTKHGRTVLNNRSEGIVHAVSPSPIVKDPEYTVYWLKVGESAGLNVEVLDRMQFNCGRNFLICHPAATGNQMKKTATMGHTKGNGEFQLVSSSTLALERMMKGKLSSIMEQFLQRMICFKQSQMKLL